MEFAYGNKLIISVKNTRVGCRHIISLSCNAIRKTILYYNVHALIYAMLLN